MASAKSKEAATFVISAKMAKALADRWRSRILMELTTRPMSPSQFVDMFGGELPHIARCFRQLAEWGFIEVAETRKGGHRRGGVEHVYRRIQRALFDTEVWEELPLAYRIECSGSTLESYISRVSEAIAAGTFDDEVDRHLSWDVVNLDRAGWKAIGARLDEILYGLPDLSLEASRRMAASGEEPIPTTVGLAAFRSPGQIAEFTSRVASFPAAPPSESPFAISAKMAKALANPWRCRIMMELGIRPLSPTLFVKEVGGQRRHITRCFAQLAEWDLIEVAETRSGGQRRGGKEKFYRLKQRAFFDTETWKELPRFLRDECSASFLRSYFARVGEAIEAGTFDGEADRHLSWDGVRLDRLGWNQLGESLDAVLSWLPELEQEAAGRLAESGEESIPTTVGLATFRSPKASLIASRPE